MIRLKRLLWFVGPPVAWASFIFYLSAQSDLPTLSTLPNFDKVEHLGVYGVLGALVFRALVGYGQPMRRALTLTFAIGALYGASDEFHQSFTPNRTPDVADATADAIGAAMGGAAWWLLLGLRSRLLQNRSAR